MTDTELIEVMARAIFEHWEFQPVKAPPVAWVPGGNSMKQDTARAYAREALAVVREHDGAELAAVRAELAKEVKNKKEFERDWLDACDQLSKAEAEAARLRAALKKAPHDPLCAVIGYLAPCNCWKRAALAQEGGTVDKAAQFFDGRPDGHHGEESPLKWEGGR